MGDGSDHADIARFMRSAEGQAYLKAVASVLTGRRIESVVFKINDEEIATLTQPPWEATFEAPSGDQVTYLTVTATYNDGSTAATATRPRGPQWAAMRAEAVTGSTGRRHQKSRAAENSGTIHPCEYCGLLQLD